MVPSFLRGLYQHTVTTTWSLTLQTLQETELAVVALLTGPESSVSSKLQALGIDHYSLDVLDWDLTSLIDRPVVGFIEADTGQVPLASHRLEQDLAGLHIGGIEPETHGSTCEA